MVFMDVRIEILFAKRTKCVLFCEEVVCVFSGYKVLLYKIWLWWFLMRFEDWWCR